VLHPSEKSVVNGAGAANCRYAVAANDRESRAERGRRDQIGPRHCRPSSPVAVA
jgi:hypothetical protein